MLSEMSPQNMANPNGQMFCNMASTLRSRLSRYHDAVRAEILRHCSTVQRVRALICTMEGLQQAHVRDGLVLGLAQPNAKAPSKIRPCPKEN